MSNAIVPVVPKRNAVPGAGYPTALALGELAVNTTTGDVYLGADPGVVQIGVALAAGTLLTLGTGNGSTVAFTIAGGTGIDAGGYLVSVGGVDQPNGWTVAGTTLTFSEAPPIGAVVSVRAILKGVGSGGSGNATQLQGRDIATTAPTAGQFLMWAAANNQWEPTTLAGGSVTFSTEGTHYWRVPAYARYARVQAGAGNGTAGTNGAGTMGENGGDMQLGAPPVGANGINGSGTSGTAGRSITFDSVTVTGGAAGQAGGIGYGGGGGGGFDLNYNIYNNGAAGNGPAPGQGGYSATSGALGGAGGPGGGYGQSGSLGTGSYHGGGGGGGGGGRGGNGGGEFGGYGGSESIDGNGSGGGGGGAGTGSANYEGMGGYGGTGTGATAGGAGETLDTYHVFTPGALVPITISAGAGEASITITY